MNTTISVFNTIKTTFETIFFDIKLFFRGLAIPFTLLLTIQLALVYCIYSRFISTLSPTYLASFCTLLVSLLVITTIMFWNITSRITIHRSIGHLGWKKPETKTLLKSLGVLFYSLIALLGMMLFLNILFYAVYFFMDVTNDYVPAFISLATDMLSTTFAAYITARFSIIVPATSIGQSMKLKEAWKKTKNNGWRLFCIYAIPTGLTYMCSNLCVTYFGVNMFSLMATLPIALFSQVILMVSCAVVYKNTLLQQAVIT